MGRVSRFRLHWYELLANTAQPDRHGRSLDACHFLNFQRGQTFQPQKRQAPISRAKLRYSPFQIHESNVERFRLWRTDVFQSRLAGLTPPVPYLPRQCHVVGNAIEPGALTRFATKCRERAPYAYKNFLKQVLTVSWRASIGPAQASNSASVGLHKPLEPLFIAESLAHTEDSLVELAKSNMWA
jgi:hypothetical protein